MRLHNPSNDLPCCALHVALSYTQGADSDLLSGLGTISNNAVLKYTAVLGVDELMHGVLGEVLGGVDRQADTLRQRWES